MASMHPNNALRYGQTQASPSSKRITGIIHPKERLKNLCQSFGRHTGAEIPDRNRSDACRPIHDNFNIASRWCTPNRVSKNIPKSISQQFPTSPQLQMIRSAEGKLTTPPYRFDFAI